MTVGKGLDFPFERVGAEIIAWRIDQIAGQEGGLGQPFYLAVIGVGRQCQRRRGPALPVAVEAIGAEPEPERRKRRIAERAFEPIVAGIKRRAGDPREQHRPVVRHPHAEKIPRHRPGIIRHRQQPAALAGKAVRGGPAQRQFAKGLRQLVTFGDADQRQRTWSGHLSHQGAGRPVATKL